MTAILNKIRMLEASRNSGALSQEDFVRAKARLLDTVEDAKEPHGPDAKPRRKAAPERIATPPLANAPATRPKATLWQTLLLCALALTGLTTLAAFLIGDLTLALTLAVTVIAAVTVRAMHVLDD